VRVGASRGDRQLSEIDAGGAFHVLAEDLDTLELTEIRRQRELWDRDALDALRNGDIERWARLSGQRADERGRQRARRPRRAGRRLVAREGQSGEQPPDAGSAFRGRRGFDPEGRLLPRTPGATLVQSQLQARPPLTVFDQSRTRHGGKSACRRCLLGSS
jgi:hypothetical protein